jgi:hypothetical protein
MALGTKLKEANSALSEGEDAPTSPDTSSAATCIKCVRRIKLELKIMRKIKKIYSIGYSKAKDVHKINVFSYC